MASARILIIEDNAFIREILKESLEEKGYSVCGEAEDGAPGIDKAKELKPDLICLDLYMPEMNGVEAASVLKHALPETPIILLTIYQDKLGKSLASAAGVDRVVAKPEGITKLDEVIKELLPAAER